MNYEDEAEELIVPSNVHNILIMLVLTHVFMSKGVASDGKLVLSLIDKIIPLLFCSFIICVFE